MRRAAFEGIEVPLCTTSTCSIITVFAEILFIFTELLFLPNITIFDKMLVPVKLLLVKLYSSLTTDTCLHKLG